MEEARSDPGLFMFQAAASGGWSGLGSDVSVEGLPRPRAVRGR